MKYIYISILLLMSSCRISDMKLALLCKERFPNPVTVDSSKVDSSRSSTVTEALPPVTYWVDCPISNVPTSINVTLPGGFVYRDSFFSTKTVYQTQRDSKSIFILENRLLKAGKKAETDSLQLVRQDEELKAKSKSIRRLWIALGIVFLIIGIFFGFRLSKSWTKILSFFGKGLRG